MPSATISSRSRRRRQGGRRPSARQRAGPDQHPGFLLGAAAGAILESQGGGARQCRCRYHPAEFGIFRGGQKLAGLLVFINDVNTLGLEAAQGILLTNAFYWDRNEESRSWAQRYFQRMRKMPNMTQAGIYSATTQYLNAVEAAGTDATQAVMDKMRATPVNDFFARNGKIRDDGRMVHDMYLYEVKKPGESTGAWDYYKPVATIPAEEAFQPLSESKCPVAK
jgi:branched-chain amino acid transport system substrate-binding protein